MKNVVVGAVLAGLAYSALKHGNWPWLVATIGLALAFYFGRSARLSTRIQLLVVGGLGGGLGAEIVVTLTLAVRGMAQQGAMYKQALIVSLGSVIIVFGAMIVEFLLRVLYSHVRNVKD